jgi:hypothetical protein
MIKDFHCDHFSSKLKIMVIDYDSPETSLGLGEELSSVSVVAFAG